MSDNSVFVLRNTTSPQSLRAFSSRRRRMSTESVLRLVKLAGAGDERAWRTIVDEFAGLVWAVTRAHRLDHADAADVVQTTFVRLVEHLPGLQQPERVGAWLATTARRECLAVLRQRARLVPLGDALPDPVADEPEPGSALFTAERDATLWHAFKRLRSSDQALLRVLMADPAPSYEEVQAALSMPIGSIGPTRARALERLRREAERLGLTHESLSA
jgi:RNA polymerase sigma factor (sigma-70 family)